MTPEELARLTGLAQSNPMMLGQFFRSAGVNPGGVAGVMDHLGVPTPDTPEWAEMLNPMSGLGAMLEGGANTIGTDLAGGPPPVSPAMGLDMPPQLDPRMAVQTSDILAAMAPPGGAGPMPGGNPLAGTEAAIQTGQRPLGRIPVPQQQRAPALAGSQKAPESQAKGGAMQALLQAIMGRAAGSAGGGGSGQVPPLGALLR